MWKWKPQKPSLQDHKTSISLLCQMTFPYYRHCELIYRNKGCTCLSACCWIIKVLHSFPTVLYDNRLSKNLCWHPGFYFKSNSYVCLYCTYELLLNTFETVILWCWFKNISGLTCQHSQGWIIVEQTLYFPTVLPSILFHCSLFLSPCWGCLPWKVNVPNLLVLFSEALR